jgi:hypothetical protein
MSIKSSTFSLILCVLFVMTLVLRFYKPFILIFYLLTFNFKRNKIKIKLLNKNLDKTNQVVYQILHQWSLQLFFIFLRQRSLDKRLLHSGLGKFILLFINSYFFFYYTAVYISVYNLQVCKYNIFILLSII